MLPSPEAALLQRLGYQRLTPLWAKLEIFIGLGAVGFAAALALSDALGQMFGGVGAGVMAWVLFVCGGYLAMAGHRSHLYQSQNAMLALLVGRPTPE